MNSLIINTLSQLGVPVSFQTYNGSETTYITFFEYNQMPGLNAEDDEFITNFSVQVDVWSLGNYLNLVKQVKQAMKQAGFRRFFETELYEDETRYFHKVLRFSYHKEA